MPCQAAALLEEHQLASSTQQTKVVKAKIEMATASREIPLLGGQLLGQGGGMVRLVSWMEEHRTHKEKENLEINFEADGSWWASLVVVVGVTVGVPGSRTSFKSSSINWKWPAWTIAALSYRIPPKSASFCWLNMTVREMMVRSDVCNSRCYC